MIDTIIVPLIIFAYGFLLMHLGLAFLSIKNRRRIHDITFALTIDFSVMCIIGSYTVYNGLSSKALNLVVFATLVAIAPIGLDLFIELFNVREKWRHAQRASFILTGAVIAGAAYLFFAGARTNLIYAFGYGWLLIVLSPFFALESKNILPLGTMPEMLKILYVLLCLDVFFIFGIFIAQLTGYITLSSPFWFLLINSLILKIATIVKNPATYSKIEDEISVRREVRSKIANLDENLLNERLRSAMSDDRLFLDPELRLASLSKRVKITPHQLSEFINKKHSMTFNNFVNKYRIEYACSLLLEDRDRPIIDIVFESGFNSKSAFNATFKAITGKTPTAYCGEIPTSKKRHD
jgi:AraC-like DNA-binding protein/uncharacterized membrane protein (UPF0136 family)